MSDDRPHRPRRGRQPSPATVREIYRCLRDRFGLLDPPRRRDPLEELVVTVLSQNSSDVNRDRAYAAMRRRFPTWEALAEADPVDLAGAIRPGGLANIKAPRLLAVLREIGERESGSLDLSWMRGATPAKVRDYLTSLPGVGPKTAACVLAFSLGRAALPVDTHVFRVARRLGFLDQRTDAARAHAVMEAAVPPALRIRMHVGLIRLGREICRAGRPRCEVCPLQDLCPTSPSILKERVTLRGRPRSERVSRSPGGGGR
jgi:endonuclease-3